LKGDLVGTCLDLEIRHRTRNQFGLDEVLRRLYERYGSKGIGFPESVYQETVEEVASSSFQEFFNRFIEGTDPIPFEDFLGYAGLTVERTYKNPDPDEDHDEGQETHAAPVAWLGIEAEVINGHELAVKHAYSTGPACDRLNPGDQLLAIDGFAVNTAEQLKDRIRQDFQIGDHIEVAFFRRKALQSVTITLAEAPPDVVKVVPLVHADSDQKDIYAKWLATPWEPPAK
jgi:predicted metalloprotease with PDZ domain